MEEENYGKMGEEGKADMTIIPACPRCAGADTRLIANSPIAGVWQMYGCNHCTYLWRNTETLEGIRTITDKEMESAVLDFPPSPAEPIRFRQV